MKKLYTVAIAVLALTAISCSGSDSNLDNAANDSISYKSKAEDFAERMLKAEKEMDDEKITALRKEYDEYVNSLSVEDLKNFRIEYDNACEKLLCD